MRPHGRISWRVKFRPEGEQDMAAAAGWYEAQPAGLRVEYVEEVILMWNALIEDPVLICRRHPGKNIR